MTCQDKECDMATKKAAKPAKKKSPAKPKYKAGDTLAKPKRSDGKSFKVRPPKRGLTRKTIEGAADKVEAALAG